MSGHLPRWVSLDRDLGPAPADLELRYLRLTLARSAEREAAFQQLLLDQQNPGSKRYHGWLTPEQIGEQFGPTPHDIQQIREWLESEGLQVDFVANSRMFIVFDGSAAQVARAFHAEMHRYAFASGTRLSVATAPRIPLALAAVVQSIQGLSEHALHAASHAVPGYTPCYGDICYHYIVPADFATIYGINPVYAASIYGAGQTIAIVGRAQVWGPDVTEYEAITGLPDELENLIVPPSGVTPPTPNDSTTQTPNGDQTEATLDVQRSLGTAPQATVDLVASLSTETEDGIDIAKDYVIDSQSTLHAYILSNSFGECEADVAASFVQADDTLFQQGAAEGISILGISGDAGAAGCDSYNSIAPAVTEPLSPNYLCSSSYVTCLGGTEFNDTADPSEYWSTTSSSTLESALSYIPEGAWNEPGPDTSGNYYASATGGGVSSVIATPYWQTGTGVPGVAGRYTPDIAFSSSAHDGYYGCYAAGGGYCADNYYEYFYGTSAAAPSMAGVVALLNQKVGGAQGNLNPVLYSLAAATANNVFHDTTIATSGVANCVVTTPSMCNNSVPAPATLTGGQAGYELSTGYDLATGWGSVDVANLLNSWATGGPVATTTTLTISPGTSFASGTAATLTAKVAGSGSTPSGSVSFYLGTTFLGSSNLAAGTASITANTAGLPAGSYAVQARYRGTATSVPSSSAITTVTLTAPATTTTLTVSPGDSMAVGTTGMLIAKVSSAGTTPTGSVSFYYGSFLLGTATLSAGTASLTESTAGIPPGSYPLQAKFPGSSSGAASSSAIVTVTLTAPSTTTMTVTPSTVTPPAQVTLTAKVSSTAGTPTGSVTFYYGTLALGTASLISGSASMSQSTAGIPAGKYGLFAVFSGNATTAGSTSATITATLN